jgi:RsiW-degrading membrane proteinase PrsW (M82 family)
MFWITIVVLIGSGYLFHRYRLAANKDRFFRSPLFVSLTGCFAILVSTVLIVNLFSPSTPRHASVYPAFDTLNVEEQDTSFENLASKGAAFHYALIEKVTPHQRYIDYRWAIERQYKRFLSGDAQTVQMGNFCLGVFALAARKYDIARAHFQRVPDPEFPYINFVKGKLALQESKKSEAEAYFKKELSIKNGFRRGAYLKLVSLYDESENYDGLRTLLNHEEAATCFPEYLARITLLNTGEFREYLFWIYKSIVNRINLAGFIAALLISIVWIFYLFQLHVFQRNRYLLAALMFVCGMLSVFALLTFSDIQDIVLPWSLSGYFFNDLLYSIFIIGAPEEFAKFFPLLMLMMVRGSFREPIDYIILASASALGFAFVENLLYFQKLNGSIIHGRAYFAAIGHMVDSSFVAYGYVVARFQLKKKSSLAWVLPLTFLAGSLTHGIYDFLLFHEYLYIFFIVFVLAIQFWVIIINNCLNNSGNFSYRYAARSERSRVYVAMALTVVFAYEYVISGFNTGLYEANIEFIANIPFSGFLIIFFSSNLSSFDLVRGYWRRVYFMGGKKGVTARNSNLLVSWYFVNSICAQNYVGLKVRLFNDPYNKSLGEVFQGSSFNGTIVNRVILYDENGTDPHWFIVRMDRPVPFENERRDYVLIKLRDGSDSLSDEDAVQIFFKSIPDASMLRKQQPAKSDFPFYGWAYASLVEDEAT